MTGLSDNNRLVIHSGTSSSLLVCSPGHTLPGAVHSLPEEIVVEEGASLEITVIMLASGETQSLTADVYICGENASFSIGGAVVALGDSRCSVKINVRHTAGGGYSHQQFRTIAADSAKVSFDGKITVAQDSQKTEAYQENHNLLLSEKAVISTMPQLEIYADDVKCSHGATIGKLDENERFYLRSRGIPDVEARHLQIHAFVSPSLSLIKDPDTKEQAGLLVDGLLTSY